MINIRWLGRPDAPSLGEIYTRFFTLNPDDHLTGMSGTFTPAHLWFILYLFLFSLVALPIFLLLRRPASQRALSWLADWSGSAYLLIVPLALARSVDLIGLGAKDPLYYFLVFLSGYVLTSQPRFQQAIDQTLWLSLALALTATALPQILPLASALPDSTAQIVRSLLYRLSQWTWVLAILGAGHRWLNRDNNALRYFSEAAYPFYILHLPVDTLVAYVVIQLNVSLAAKYTLIVVATTVVTLEVYDLVVKRVGLLRLCFGMKPLAPAAHLRRSRREPAH